MWLVLRARTVSLALGKMVVEPGRGDVIRDAMTLAYVVSLAYKGGASAAMTSNTRPYVQQQFSRQHSMWAGVRKGRMLLSY